MYSDSQKSVPVEQGVAALSNFNLKTAVREDENGACA